MPTSPPEPASSPPRRGPLAPIEMAQAAVLSGVSVALVIAGWYLPHASAIAALAAVPLGVVAHRHRPRAVMAATVAACFLAFLIAGTGPLYGIVMCALVGGLVGDTKRRGFGIVRTMAAAAVLAPLVAGVTVGLLAVFASLRKLTLVQVRNAWHGFTGVVANVPGLSGVAHTADHWIDTALRYWWATVGLSTMLLVFGAVLLAWKVLGGALERLAWVPAEDRLEPAACRDHEEVGPLPVEMRDVEVRYAGVEAPALSGVSLRLAGPEMVAVVGPNGSGKSTLGRVLAGVAPTSGTVERPGNPGLGLRGGTAMVHQRPESQVLGVRVADDVVWGLPPGAPVDVRALLAQVGLAGMEDRDATTLSGGELQRLAVAAALARRPCLLISDESTAMVDAEGRALLTGLLARLPADHATTVVHITHRKEEAASADRVLRLEHGRLVHVEPSVNGQVAAPPAPGPDIAGSAFAVEGVSHTYAERTPWAQPALHDVNLAIAPGEGVLVVGGNGSGKSTLAWILAGLTRPSAGRCLLDGRPVTEQVGRVGVAFQHARLQVQRRNVGADVRAAGGVNRKAAAAALRLVGLDPETLEGRPVDQLSGGQLRRVALAGLLTRRPGALVLDEPLAGLDDPSQQSLLDVLRALRRAGLTLIVISHDLAGMPAVCDRAVHLDRGRVVADQPVDDALAARPPVSHPGERSRT